MLMRVKVSRLKWVATIPLSRKGYNGFNPTFCQSIRVYILPHPMTSPAYWPDAIAYLSAQDAVMAKLIATYPDAVLSHHQNPFHTLVRAIVGQQISVKAADAVWQRLTLQLQPISPAAYLAGDPEQWRQCGLSRQKIEYIGNIAQAFQSGLLTPDRWEVMDDRAIAKQLMAIKGIGRWTAEMFLIFYLHRADIFPLADLGLIKAIQHHYGTTQALTQPEIIQLSQQWQPYCTVATWYLWRSLDPVVVQY